MAEPTQPISSFDPEVFWALHKQKVVFGAVLAAFIALCGSAYFGFQILQTQNAEKAYAAAQSIDGWQAVIRQYPGSVAAGNAYLRIAAKLTEDGKYPESDSNYETFIRQFQKHPLLVNAYMGLATNAELEKNLDKALENYKKVVTLFGSSFQAPIALFHEARITAAKGQLKEAKTLYASVVQRFGESIAAELASREASNLADKIPPETTAKANDAAASSPPVTPATVGSPASPASTSPPNHGPAKPEP